MPFLVRALTCGFAFTAVSAEDGLISEQSVENVDLNEMVSDETDDQDEVEMPRLLGEGGGNKAEKLSKKKAKREAKAARKAAEKAERQRKKKEKKEEKKDKRVAKKGAEKAERQRRKNEKKEEKKQKRAAKKAAEKAERQTKKKEKKEEKKAKRAAKKGKGSGKKKAAEFTFGGAIGDDVWKLVRRVKAGNTWHPATDGLAGTDEYGTPSDDKAADSTWSVRFDNMNCRKFLFATGDNAKWLIATRDSVLGDWYSNTARPILKSSKHSTPSTAKWYRRKNQKEDPWISTIDHGTATRSEELLYGENSFKRSTYADVLTNHNGANVYCLGD